MRDNSVDRRDPRRWVCRQRHHDRQIVFFALVTFISGSAA